MLVRRVLGGGMLPRPGLDGLELARLELDGATLAALGADSAAAGFPVGSLLSDIRRPPAKVPWRLREGGPARLASRMNMRLFQPGFRVCLTEGPDARRDIGHFSGGSRRRSVV